MTYVNDSHGYEAADLGASVEDYFALLKPRVMSLVVFTALVGMLLAPIAVHPVIGVIAILCIAIGGGASGALNMWYDADIDAIMSRTRNRPIPAGRMTKQEALGFGVVLSIFSVTILGLATNWLAAGLLAFTILYYVLVYTMWLKRRTPQNIVIGGAAGALPTIVGWAAVTGSISIEPIILFLIVFLWTPPHFWALSLYKQSDYKAANIPMLPVVAGEKATKVQITLYALLLATTGLLPVVFGFAGFAYAAVASVVGLVMIVLSVRLFQVDGAEMRRRANRLFLFSLSYLFIVFSALLIETLAFRFMSIG